MEDKNVQKLLDMLYSMIDEAKGSTFNSDRCVISREEAKELIDEIRSKLPGELGKAQELMKAREQYVDDVRKQAQRVKEKAQEEADRLLEQARREAETIVSESELLKQARKRANDILRQAEERSRELFQVTNGYTEDALRRTEEAVQAALNEVQESRKKFRATSAEQARTCQEQAKVVKTAATKAVSEG